jgi:hypothetical protein
VVRPDTLTNSIQYIMYSRVILTVTVTVLLFPIAALLVTAARTPAKKF